MEGFIVNRLSTYGPPSSAMTPQGVPGSGENLAVRAIGDGGRTSFTSNEVNTVLSFLPMQWEDAHEQLIRNGSIVFVARNTKQQRNNIVEWSKLNEILRKGAALFRDKFGIRNNEATFGVKPGDSIRQLDHDQRTTKAVTAELYGNAAKRYASLSEKCKTLPPAYIFSYVNSEPYNLARAVMPDSDTQLDDYNAFRTTNKVVYDTDPNFWDKHYNQDPAADLAYRELVELHVETRESIARYATVENIRRFWNFLGIVNNTNEGKGLQAGSITPKASTMAYNATVLNVIVDKHARTPNRWGDEVTEKTRLYAVLTRKKLENGTWSDYQIYPWCTNVPGETPDSDPSIMLHEDYYGNAANGHYWYIGKVQHRNLGKASQYIRLQACGVQTEDGKATSPALAFTQQAKLESLEIISKRIQ